MRSSRMRGGAGWQTPTMGGDADVVVVGAGFAGMYLLWLKSSRVPDQGEGDSADA